jgi:hypothetical protein
VVVGAGCLEAAEEQVVGLDEFHELEAGGDAEDHCQDDEHADGEQGGAEPVKARRERDPGEVDVGALGGDEPEGGHDGAGGEGDGHCRGGEAAEPAGAVDGGGPGQPAV